MDEYASNIRFCFGTNLKRINSKITLNTNGLYRPVTEFADAEFFRNDWTTLAFRGFTRVRALTGNTVKSFATIGTGSGFDAIGAVEAFELSRVMLTELRERDATTALINVNYNIADKSVDIGAVCADALTARGLDELKELEFDLIYENLPNLPEELHNHGIPRIQPWQASFAANNLNGVPELYGRFLLGSHYLALKNLRSLLTETGGILCNIGGRAPYELIRRMFEELGFSAERLVFEFKVQSEAETNLPAYAQWENQTEGVTFSYYPYAVLKSQDIRELEKSAYDRISGFLKSADTFERLLSRHRLSAREAVCAYEQGTKIGHTVHTIYARPIRGRKPVS
jgi:methylase of polypeptide subunit release factors